MSPTPTDLSAGVPERVWQKAVARGLHNDCIQSGVACEACEDTIMKAFEDVYGEAQNMDEVLSMIAYDLSAERVRELSP